MKVPSIVDVQNVLNQAEIAKVLSEKEKALLLDNLKVISYAKGETIYKQGSVICDYPILISGLCKVTVENPFEGNGTIIALVQPVKFIGVFSLEDTEYQATTTALSDSVVAFLDKKFFSQLMLTNGKFCYKMFEVLCNYTKTFVRMSVDFSQKSILARVASSLLYIAEMVNGNRINLPISRNDLAEYSGIATGSTIRLLSDLEKDGIIVLDKKTITIMDQEALRRISMQGE